MDNIFEMGATKRHGQTIGAFFSEVWERVKAKELLVIADSCGLVYYGNKQKCPANCELIMDIADEILFKNSIINDLGAVTPDFMVFQKNSYIMNNKETRIAGCPDLIVEVWSEDNSDKDRAFKKYLYATSPTTEHWYIEQDSNVVECWYGQERIENKNLENILISRNGIKFDLRYLKLDDPATAK